MNGKGGKLMLITFKASGGFLTVDGVFYRGDCDRTLTPGERAYAVWFPSDGYGLPFSAAVEIVGGVPVGGGDRLVFTELAEDAYLAEFQHREITEYHPPEEVLQEQLTVSGMPHLITVFRDTRLRAIMENAHGSATFDLPDLKEPRLFLRGVSFGLLAIITGAVGADKKYMRLLSYDGGFKSIFETECDDLIFNKNTFTTVCKKQDMLGRAVARSYNFNNGKFEAENTVFTYENERVYPAELLPYLFLEAFAAGDDAKLIKYLSDDLAASAGYFKEYLAPFEKIMPDYAGTSSEVAVLTGNGKYKKIVRYRFEIKDNKISNLFRV
jgi:hypothetical protein